MNSSAHYLEELAWRRAYALVLSWPRPEKQTAYSVDLGRDAEKAAEEGDLSKSSSRELYHAQA